LISTKVKRGSKGRPFHLEKQFIGTTSGRKNILEGSATDMGCGSSTPVVASTATTPRELSVRSGTASLLSSEGTPAGRFLSPGSLSELEAHPKLTPPTDSKQVGWLKSLRGAGSRTGPMGRSLPPFQRGFSSHSKHDVCCSSSSRRRSRFFSACTPRPRGSTDHRL